MSQFIIDILSKQLGQHDARRLVEAGLLDATRFHYRTPIDVEVAKLLHNLKSLRVIQFHDIKPNAQDLSLLNDEVFAKRKEISLRVFGYSDTWSDISIFKQLHEVERFDWESDVFGSIEPLFTLKKLVHLGLGLTQPKPKISIGFVSDLKDALDSLCVRGDYKDTLATIPQLINLRSIQFFSTKLSGFEFLEGLRIETLGNYGGSVASFDAVRRMTSVKRLWIKTNTKLDNIDFVEGLMNLERLELLFLSKLTRTPKCDHLKKLRLIFAYTCNRLVDISELLKLDGVKIGVFGNSLKGKVIWSSLAGHDPHARFLSI